MDISPVHQLCTSSKWPSAIERSGRQARMRRARRRAVVDVIKNVLARHIFRTTRSGALRGLSTVRVGSPPRAA